MKHAELLSVRDLHVQVGEKEILHGVNLSVGTDETHVLLGPNGTGKSTLGYAITGNPAYQVTRGSITFDGEDITSMPVNERAKKGVFLSFQNPLEVPGVTLSAFIRTALEQKSGSRIRLWDFKKKLKETMALLSMDESYAERDLNVGFSGGEKKKAEILQLLMLIRNVGPERRASICIIRNDAKILRRKNSCNVGSNLVNHADCLITLKNVPFIRCRGHQRIDVLQNPDILTDSVECKLTIRDCFFQLLLRIVRIDRELTVVLLIRIGRIHCTSGNHTSCPIYQSRFCPTGIRHRILYIDNTFIVRRFAVYNSLELDANLFTHPLRIRRIQTGNSTFRGYHTYRIDCRIALQLIQECLMCAAVSCSIGSAGQRNSRNCFQRRVRLPGHIIIIFQFCCRFHRLFIHAY